MYISCHSDAVYIPILYEVFRYVQCFGLQILYLYLKAETYPLPQFIIKLIHNKIIDNLLHSYAIQFVVLPFCVDNYKMTMEIGLCMNLKKIFIFLLGHGLFSMLLSGQQDGYRII